MMFSKKSFMLFTLLISLQASVLQAGPHDHDKDTKEQSFVHRLTGACVRGTRAVKAAALRYWHKKELAEAAAKARNKATNARIAQEKKEAEIAQAKERFEQEVSRYPQMALYAYLVFAECLRRKPQTDHRDIDHEEHEKIERENIVRKALAKATTVVVRAPDTVQIDEATRCISAAASELCNATNAHWSHVTTAFSAADRFCDLLTWCPLVLRNSQSIDYYDTYGLGTNGHDYVLHFDHKKLPLSMLRNGLISCGFSNDTIQVVTECDQLLFLIQMKNALRDALTKKADINIVEFEHEQHIEE